MRVIKLETFLRTIIIGGASLIVASVLVQFNYFIHSPNYGQTFLLFFLIDLMALAYIPLAYLFPRYRPRSSALFLSLLIFLLICLITGFTGVNTFYSLFGLPMRMTGFLTLLQFTIFFVVLGHTLREFTDWKILLRVFCFVTIAATLYNIAVLGSFDFSRIFRDELLSTFGNVGDYAVFLLMSLACSAFLLINESNRFFRVFAWIAFFLALVSVPLSGHRAAILGLFVAIIVFLTLYVLLFRSSFAYRSLVFGGFGVVLLGIMFAAVFGANVIPHIQQLYESSLQIRFFAWNMAWQGFLEHPFAGWGLQNFLYVADAYYPAALFRYGMAGGWLHNPHNEYLNLLAATGIFGLISYLGVFATALYSVWRRSMFDVANLQRLGVIVFTAFFSAYIVRSIFAFHMPIPLVFLFMIFALIHSFSVSEAERRFSQAKVLIASVFSTTGIVVLLVFFTAIPAYAGYLAASCLPQNISACERAVRIAPYLKEDIVFQAYDGIFAFPRILQHPSSAAFVALILDYSRSSTDSQPSYARTFWTHGLLTHYLHQRGFGKGNELLEESKRSFERMIRLVPTRFEAHINLAQRLLDLEQFQEAVSVLENAKEYLLSDAAILYWDLARAHVAIGDDVAARDAFVTFLRLNPSIGTRHSSFLKKMIPVLERIGDHELSAQLKNSLTSLEQSKP